MRVSIKDIRRSSFEMLQILHPIDMSPSWLSVWFYGMLTHDGLFNVEFSLFFIKQYYGLLWFVMVLWHIKILLVILSYLPKPSARAGYDTGSIFKRSLTGLNSEFSFSLTSCLTKAKEPSLSYYLPIAGRRMIGFIPFPRVLVLCEMQSVWSRIWTRVAVIISYDDNHYTTGWLFYGKSCFYLYII